MDSTLNDFLNEINEIAPLKEKQSKSDCAWQECYDESSGYAYYWNTKTDEVTWEMPDAYKLWKEKQIKSSKSNLFIPPQTPSILPSNTLKIYKIESNQKIIPSLHGLRNKESVDSEKPKNVEKDSPSLESKHDKKNTLQLSYADDFESEPEVNDTRESTTSSSIEKTTCLTPSSQHDSSESSESEDDEINILTKIQRKAKVLKQLGGEIPPDVKKLVEKTIDSESSVQNKEPKKKRELTGFSLVAGYGNSDEEDEEEVVKNCFPIVDLAKNENKIISGHESLFPITESLDLKQSPETEKEVAETNVTLESKTFQRKRRIGIEFTTVKPTSLTRNLTATENERAGFGFKSSDDSKSETKSVFSKDYRGFKSGGILFLKSGVLNPSQPEVSDIDKEKKDELITKEKNSEDPENKKKMLSDIEEIRETLAEKLGFLSEGREPVSAVQVLFIQLETLNAALKAECLSPKYLLDWLKETCSQLIKLEQGAAPNGWALQWDRIGKRQLRIRPRLHRGTTQ